MDQHERKKIYAALSAPFGSDAIERTDGNVTGRGYSTTGLKYQFVVNRLNEVVGLGGFRTTQTISVRSSTTQKGRTLFDAACELTLQLGEWVDGVFIVFAEAHGTGGHSSLLEADARKGAFTNGLKKAAAMFGCGRQAYEGTLDDDNVSPLVSDGHEPDVADRRPPSRQQHASGGTSSASARTRLTSKQLATLWALALKLNLDKGRVRERIKERFGCTVEFLSRDAASTVIGELSAKLGNGHGHDAGEVA